jgi:ABC-type uncharacterized transport system auxiliary subunit
MLVLFCACASAPKIDYYTLNMEPSGHAEPKVNLSVERFLTTESLGRRRIMVLASPTRIEYYATDQWATSIGELVQQKLAAEFGAPVDGRRSLVVSGKVVAFEQVDRPGGIEARVTLEVVVRDAHVPRYQPPLFEKSYSSSRPVSAMRAESVVEELSRCVEEIAAEIATDVASL